MKKEIVTSLAVLMLMTGCGKKEPEKQATNDESVTQNTSTTQGKTASTEQQVPTPPPVAASSATDAKPVTTQTQTAEKSTAPVAPAAFDAAAKFKSTCAACHGVTAQGQGAFPKLAGRAAAELEGALKDYQAGKARGPQSAMMMPIAKQLSADEVKALAGYLSGLK